MKGCFLQVRIIACSFSILSHQILILWGTSFWCVALWSRFGPLPCTSSVLSLRKKNIYIQLKYNVVNAMLQIQLCKCNIINTMLQWVACLDPNYEECAWTMPPLPPYPFQHCNNFCNIYNWKGNNYRCMIWTTFKIFILRLFNIFIINYYSIHIIHLKLIYAVKFLFEDSSLTIMSWLNS